MTVTAVVPDVGQSVDAALSAALDADAATTPPSHPAPPRLAVSADPEAPHGRGEDGQPLAPHGINKRTGRPNLKPAGPGRGKRKDGAARVTDTPAAAAVATPAAAGAARDAGPDYRAELAGFGTAVWMGASAMKGGRLPLVKIPTPDLRGYAYAWQQELPRGVAAWNAAAKQNATVRGWVGKLAGEGSWQWVLGVGIWGANFLAACQELAGSEDLRAKAAAANDAELKAFLAEQMAMAEQQLQAEATAA